MKTSLALMFSAGVLYAVCWEAYFDHYLGVAAALAIIGSCAFVVAIWWAP